MKVLNPGREQTGWAVETSCTGYGNGGGGCGAKLLVEEADIRVRVRTLNDFDERFYCFICPCCGSYTDMDGTDNREYRNKIPKRITRNLETGLISAPTKQQEISTEAARIEQHLRRWERYEKKS